MSVDRELEEQMEREKAEITRLLEGREAWCERGDCHVQFIGPLPNAQQYICDTCLAIWAVRLTALGPAWHRIGTTAPAPETRQ
jgi:hypothetical protein